MIVFPLTFQYEKQVEIVEYLLNSCWSVTDTVANG